MPDVDTSMIDPALDPSHRSSHASPIASPSLHTMAASPAPSASDTAHDSASASPAHANTNSSTGNKKSRKKTITPGSAADFRRKEANRLAAERSRMRASEKAKGIQYNLDLATEENERLVKQIEELEAAAKARGVGVGVGMVVGQEMGRESEARQEGREGEEQGDDAGDEGHDEAEAQSRDIIAALLNGGLAGFDGFSEQAQGVAGQEGRTTMSSTWPDTETSLVSQDRLNNPDGSARTAPAAPSGPAAASTSGDAAQREDRTGTEPPSPFMRPADLAAPQLITSTTDPSPPSPSAQPTPSTSTPNAPPPPRPSSASRPAQLSSRKRKANVAFTYDPSAALAAVCSSVAVLLNAEMEKSLRDDVAASRESIAGLEKEVARLMREITEEEERWERARARREGEGEGDGEGEGGRGREREVGSDRAGGEGEGGGEGGGEGDDFGQDAERPHPSTSNQDPSHPHPTRTQNPPQSTRSEPFHTPTPLPSSTFAPIPILRTSITAQESETATHVARIPRAQEDVALFRTLKVAEEARLCPVVRMYLKVEAEEEAAAGGEGGEGGEGGGVGVLGGNGESGDGGDGIGAGVRGQGGQVGDDGERNGQRGSGVNNALAQGGDVAGEAVGAVGTVGATKSALNKRFKDLDQGLKYKEAKKHHIASVRAELKGLGGYLGLMVWGPKDHPAEAPLDQLAYSTPAIARRRRGRPPKVPTHAKQSHSMLYPSHAPSTPSNLASAHTLDTLGLPSSAPPNADTVDQGSGEGFGGATLNAGRGASASVGSGAARGVLGKGRRGAGQGSGSGRATGAAAGIMVDKRGLTGRTGEGGGAAGTPIGGSVDAASGGPLNQNQRDERHSSAAIDRSVDVHTEDPNFHTLTDAPHDEHDTVEHEDEDDEGQAQAQAIVKHLRATLAGAAAAAGAGAGAGVGASAVHDGTVEDASFAHDDHDTDRRTGSALIESSDAGASQIGGQGGNGRNEGYGRERNQHGEMSQAVPVPAGAGGVEGTGGAADDVLEQLKRTGEAFGASMRSRMDGEQAEEGGGAGSVGVEANRAPKAGHVGGTPNDRSQLAAHHPTFTPTADPIANITHEDQDEDEGLQDLEGDFDLIAPTDLESIMTDPTAAPVGSTILSGQQAGEGGGEEEEGEGEEDMEDADAEGEGENRSMSAVKRRRDTAIPVNATDPLAPDVLEQLKNGPPGSCDICARTASSVWRKMIIGGEAFRVCNACGLYHKKFGVIRPAALWGDGGSFRKRRPAKGPDEDKRRIKRSRLNTDTGDEDGDGSSPDRYASGPGNNMSHVSPHISLQQHVEREYARQVAGYERERDSSGDGDAGGGEGEGEGTGEGEGDAQWGFGVRSQVTGSRSRGAPRGRGRGGSSTARSSAGTRPSSGINAKPNFALADAVQTAVNIHNAAGVAEFDPSVEIDLASMAASARQGLEGRDGASQDVGEGEERGEGGGDGNEDGDGQGERAKERLRVRGHYAAASDPQHGLPPSEESIEGMEGADLGTGGTGGKRKALAEMTQAEYDIAHHRFDPQHHYIREAQRAVEQAARQYQDEQDTRQLQQNHQHSQQQQQQPQHLHQHQHQHHQYHPDLSELPDLPDLPDSLHMHPMQPVPVPVHALQGMEQVYGHGHGHGHDGGYYDPQVIAAAAAAQQYELGQGYDAGVHLQHYDQGLHQHQQALAHDQQQQHHTGYAPYSHPQLDPNDPMMQHQLQQYQQHQHQQQIVPGLPDDLSGMELDVGDVSVSPDLMAVFGMGQPP